MKIALLSGMSSIHTIRWANAFCSIGHEVHIISIQKPIEPPCDSVNVHMLPFSAPMGYYLNVFALKSLLKKIHPDATSVHYASGYGTLARLANCHPYVLSVWGSDVYDFPEKSKWHASLIRKNLLAADKVCSTSHVMARQTHKTCPNLPIEQIAITPFGVDTTIFFPVPGGRDDNYITIGTVKSLAPKYGIDVLLKSFSYAYKKLREENLSLAEKMRLMIIGSGPQEKELKKLSELLGISKKCVWKGRVPHGEVPRFLNKLDIYVALSRLDSESFGVAIIEASACGVPVVVSDAGGLPEVVVAGETGFIVKRESSVEAGEKILKLIKNTELRKIMGEKGVKNVKLLYEWHSNTLKLEKELFSTI